MVSEDCAWLDAALQARQPLLDDAHQTALRLFNGFYEGCPALVIDLYARTLVLYNYADDPTAFLPTLQAAQNHLLSALPWVQSVIIKTRRAQEKAMRSGILTLGSKADTSILENGVRYAINLQMNQDASFYLDTRPLRAWLKANLAGKTMLNTFAYTGSLGVAALAGGARRVVQLDRNPRFLDLASFSCRLNRLQLKAMQFLYGDFHRQTARLRHDGSIFDCVVLDPPYFSSAAAGKVDLVHETARLINKVRPLVAHNGWLVAINNALFVSGGDYLHTLETLSADGYLKLEKILPVPEDVTGFPGTRVTPPPIDPAPFNHPTKIAVLRVTRKEG